MKGVIFGLLIITLVALPLYAACAEEEATTPPTTPTTAPPTTPTVETHWWDKFGEPQYGGAITVATDMYMPNYDVTNFMGGEWQFWYESLFEPDWTLDRQTWSFQGGWVPDQYWEENLAESWEQTDPTTITVRIRQGIHWPDTPPVNGREFTAYDIQEHYDRILGTGSGYTEPNPMFAGTLANWERVTATDKYTVVFKFKTPCAGVGFQSIANRTNYNVFEAPESVDEQNGNIADWTKVVGTGPWMLTDIVEGSSLTYSKNPAYWGTDPRHPENQVPYADELKVLIIPDPATRLSALRTGQIDMMSDISWQQADALLDTNPDLQKTLVSAGAWGVTFRLDKAPFTDIRVREALQLSINRPLIAQTYYGGVASETPSGIITPAYKGYAYDYSEWPQELKDEYSYNLDLAKELLAEAAQDGVFEPNELGGFDTNVVCPNIFDLQLMQLIQSSFMDIGVDMTINAMDWPTYEGYFRASMHDQMISFIGALYVQEVTRVIDQFYSQGSDRGATCVNDAEYDAIRDRFWSSNNAAEAAQAMKDADEYIIRQHWLVLGPEYYTYNFWQPYLKAYSGEDLMWGAGITYARLWID